MPTDDRTLLRKTHAGHEPAARELWQRHAGWMLAYARTIVGNQGSLAAEDVVQSVFCRLLALDRRTLRSVREVRPWLAQLVRHEALNQRRSARRAAQRDARTPPSPHTAEPAAQSPHDLARVLAQLPRRLREVAHLRHIAGLTTDQTAEVLDIPRGTVASRCHEAMRTMRDMLDSPPPSTPDSPPPAFSSPDLPQGAMAPKPAGAPRHVLAD